MASVKFGQEEEDTSSCFTTRRLSPTTFVIRESDRGRDLPLMYAKLHPRMPILVLSDVGGDVPAEEHRHDRFVHLRDYIENCPIAANSDRPLNPAGGYEINDNGARHSHPRRRSYVVICTHCHYDHIGGIEQFAELESTEIVASAAGRHFIESDLKNHGGFDDRTVPRYKVTQWVESFERPIYKHRDLDVSIIHTQGHTPDELAWYDHLEMRLGVGDSFYEEGEEVIPILFDKYSNLIEWVFSMQKLLVFVRSENAREAAEMELQEANGDVLSSSGENDLSSDWVQVPRRVRVSCAHQTADIDAETVLADLEKFAARVFEGKVPVVKSEVRDGERFCWWRDCENEDVKMSIAAPLRLMQDARRFFNLKVGSENV